MVSDDPLAKLLAKILRKRAVELSLEMSIDGYCKVSDILKLKITTKAGLPLDTHTVEDVLAVANVHHSGFSTRTRDGELCIRANKGHYMERVAMEIKREQRILGLGKTFSKILRHRAENLKLEIRCDGFCEVEKILNLNIKTNAGVRMSLHTVADVLEAARTDNKQRFSTMEENHKLYIRANQGHTIRSVTGEGGVPLFREVVNSDEFPTCVHGTFNHCLPAIMEQGLHRMKRNHVHFAIGLGTQGVVSGIRRNAQVGIFINLAKAMEDGMKFYFSLNGVVLTPGFDGIVPHKYFDRVISLEA